MKEFRVRTTTTIVKRRKRRKDSDIVFAIALVIAVLFILARLSSCHVHRFVRY